MKEGAATSSLTTRQPPTEHVELAEGAPQPTPPPLRPASPLPPEPSPGEQGEELHRNYISWLQEGLSQHYTEPACQMKAVEALRILQSSGSNRECKLQLEQLLARECRDLVRVLLKGRPGGAGNEPSITQEDADSPQANRRRPQAPLNASYAPSQGTISELSFSHDADSLSGTNLDPLGMEDEGQEEERMHRPPLQRPVAGPGRPSQAQSAWQAQI